LGAIRSLSVSAMVVATAAGPGLMGVAIDHGVPFSTQMTCLALWALASCVLLFFAAHAIEKRNALQE
jgi:predicted MFS family arabinose efflux permease